MNCQNITTLLSDYTDGRLAPKMDGAVRRHLQSCSACHSEAESLKDTVQLLGRFENRRLSPGFEKSLFERLDRLEPTKAKTAPASSWWGLSHSGLVSLHKPWRWAATAAALAAVGLASWQFYPGQTPPPAGAYISACVAAHESFTPDKVAPHVGVNTRPGSSSSDINPDVDVAFETTE